MFGRLREDIQSVFDRDPAARSVLEVLTCYPGCMPPSRTVSPTGCGGIVCAGWRA